MHVLMAKSIGTNYYKWFIFFQILVQRWLDVRSASILWGLRDREVAFLASDSQSSNFEYYVWGVLPSHSTHHPQFSQYEHKIGLMPHSFIHSFIQLFIHSFIHSFIHLFIHSFIHSFIHLLLLLVVVMVVVVVVFEVGPTWYNVIQMFCVCWEASACLDCRWLPWIQLQ